MRRRLAALLCDMRKFVRQQALSVGVRSRRVASGIEGNVVTDGISQRVYGTR
jgi:hypothetical protein